jgi:hypothetical protein
MIVTLQCLHGTILRARRRMATSRISLRATRSAAIAEGALTSVLVVLFQYFRKPLILRCFTSQRISLCQIGDV